MVGQVDTSNTPNEARQEFKGEETWLKFEENLTSSEYFESYIKAVA